MKRILIIADDLTGALDTGVQFSNYGIETQVIGRWESNTLLWGDQVEVQVVNSNSRRLSSKLAYEIVAEIVQWGKKNHVELVFKKTDSGFRGNIGAELQAVLDQYPSETLHLLPAYPSLGRTVKEGISYIQGELLEASVFSRDPYEPVTESHIPTLIQQQAKLAVEVVGVNEELPDSKVAIKLYDAQDIAHMDQRLDELLMDKSVRLFAGCSALGLLLVHKLSPNLKMVERKYQTKGLYISCGSLNDITVKQVDYAEKHAFDRVRVTESFPTLDALLKDVSQPLKVIVETFDFIPSNSNDAETVRDKIASSHGALMKAVVDRMDEVTVMVTGGDTLMAFMEHLNVFYLKPIKEVEEGVVLSEISYNDASIHVISKSGGFGEVDVFNKIALHIMEENN